MGINYKQGTMGIGQLQIHLKKQILKNLLPKIIAKMELVAKKEHQYQGKTGLWHLTLEKERKVQAERETQRLQELNDLNKLLNKEKLCKQAQDVR